MKLTLETITITPKRYHEIYAIHEKYHKDHPDDMQIKRVHWLVSEESQGISDWPERYGEVFAQKLGLPVAEIYEYCFMRANIEAQELLDHLGIKKVES